MFHTKTTTPQAVMAAALAMLAVATTMAAAGPAPWYKWQSKVNGKIFCQQTSPGEGWVKHSGPYKDARCTKPGTPG